MKTAILAFIVPSVWLADGKSVTSNQCTAQQAACGEKDPTPTINSQDSQEVKRLNRQIAELVVLLKEQKTAGGKELYVQMRQMRKRWQPDLY